MPPATPPDSDPQSNPARPRLGRPPKSIGRATGKALRDVLAHHALQMVEAAGPDELSLRGVAEAAGVSKKAPYLYFEDGVREMLATVAIQGFEELVAAIAKEPDNRLGLARARQVVARYVQFGVERPHLYRAMFDSRLADPLEGDGEAVTPGRGEKTYRTLRVVKVKAYQSLVAPLEDLQREGRLRPRTRPHYVGMAIGALAHGLVGEFIDEGIGARASRDVPWSELRQRMTAEVTDMLLLGLVIEQPETPADIH